MESSVFLSDLLKAHEPLSIVSFIPNELRVRFMGRVFQLAAPIRWKVPLSPALPARVSQGEGAGGFRDGGGIQIRPQWGRLHACSCFPVKMLHTRGIAYESLQVFPSLDFVRFGVLPLLLRHLRGRAPKKDRARRRHDHRPSERSA